MAQYFFDPSEQATETAWPSTTARWNTGNYTATVRAHRDGPFKDRTYLVTQVGAAQRYARTFDGVDADANRATCEVLTAFQCVSDGINYADSRVIVRGSGSAGSETCYMFLAGTDNLLKVWEFNAGTPTLLNSPGTAKTIAENGWYWMRCYANGSALKLRVWAYGSVEPSAWDVEVTDSTISAAGWIGCAHYTVSGSSGYTQFAFLSVGTGGSTPPTVVSRADFRDWCDADATPRCVLAEIGYMDSATPATAYLANMLYQSTAVDVPASQRYDEGITSVPTYAAAASELLTGRTTISIGELELDNTDAARDAWLKANFDGRDALLLIGDQSWARYNFRPICRAITEEVRNSGFGRIVLVMRDKQRLVDVAVQTNTIASGDAAGRMKPLLVGSCKMLEPVALDNATLEYQLHDGAVYSIGDTYDRGVIQTTSGTISSVNASTDTITASAAHGMVAGWEVTFATTSGNVVAGTIYYVISAGLTSTDFRISATRGGAAKDLSGSETGTFAGKGRAVDLTTGKLYAAATPTGQWRVGTATLQATNTAGANIDWLLKNKLGMTGYLDDESFDVYASSADDECGIYLTERANALDVFDALAKAIPTAYGFGRDGLFWIKRLSSVATGRITLTTDQIIGGVRFDRFLMPVASWDYKVSRNAQPLTEFASSVSTTNRMLWGSSHQYTELYSTTDSTDSQANHALAIDAQTVETYSAETGSTTGLNAWWSLRKRKCAIVSLDCTLVALDLRLGDNVRIIYPRYGLGSGVDTYVIGIRDAIDDQRCRLTLLIPDYSQAGAP